MLSCRICKESWQNCGRARKRGTKKADLWVSLCWPMVRTCACPGLKLQAPGLVLLEMQHRSGLGREVCCNLFAQQTCAAKTVEVATRDDEAEQQHDAFTG